MFDDKEMVAWKCFTCFKPPKSADYKGMSVEDFVEQYMDLSRVTEMPKDIGGNFDAAAFREEIIAGMHIAANALAVKKVKSIASPDGSPSKLARFREMADAEKPAKKAKKSKGDEDEPIDIDDDEPYPTSSSSSSSSPAKPQVNAEMTDADKVEFGAFQTFNKLSADKIKDYLRWNDQLLTGTKDQLITRIIDLSTKGRLLRCPDCAGKLILEDGLKPKILCRGHFDEDMGCRVDCSNRWDVDSAPRSTFITKKPSEEEMEGIEKENKGAGGGGGGGGGGGATAAIDEYEIADFDLETGAGKKSAATALLTACRELQVNLPEEDSDAKQVVGRIMMANLGKGMKGILHSIAADRGVKESEDKKANKAMTAEGSCAVPENAPIFSLMNEFSLLYFKESNANAGSSYRKAANAIRDCEWEITLEIAKNMHKASGKKLAGVGKGSSDKIVELLSTGTVAKLEEKRNIVANM
jgi:hypothetical protein